MRLIDHLNKLDYYCKIVESGSLKGASRVLRISQPQLTKVLKQLEETTECALVVRGPSGISLTQQGEVLYRHALNVLESTEATEFQIKSPEESLSGTLKIGTYDSIALYFFPRFLEYMKATSPKLKIDLVTAKSASLQERLINKELDLAVSVQTPSKISVLENEVLYTDSFGLYKSAQLHPSSSNRLIYFEGLRPSIPKTYKETICSDNIETVKALTEAGMGIGILPHRVARLGVLQNRLVVFEKVHRNILSNEPHQICMSWRKSRSSMLAGFRSELARFLKVWSQE